MSGYDNFKSTLWTIVALLFTSSLAFAGAVSLTKPTADTLYAPKAAQATRDTGQDTALQNETSIRHNRDNHFADRTGINGKNDRQDTALKNATSSLRARTTYYSDYNHLLNAPVLDSIGAKSVLTYGADPNGVLNCWSSVQLTVNALPHGGKIMFPNKSDGTKATYEWANNKQVNIRYTDANARYSFEFAEGAGIHFTNMTTDAVVINPDYAWTQFPAFTSNGGYFNGVDSQKVRVFKANQCSVQRNNGVYWFCRDGLRTFGYCDMVRDSYNQWTTSFPCTGYFYRAYGNGDSYSSNQLITVGYDISGNQVDANGIYLSKCAGASIIGLNGGNHVVEYCSAVDITGAHLERKTGNSIYIKGSHTNIRDNVFLGFSTIAKGIVIEDDTGAEKFKSSVTIADNEFSFGALYANSTHGSDIHIEAFNTGSRLTLNNNKGKAMEPTYFIKDPACIMVTATDADISEALSSYKLLIAGNCELKYDNGGWALADLNVSSMTGTPSLSVASSTNYPSSLTNANVIYYKVALVYNNGAMSPACQITGATPAANGNAIRLNITIPSWPATLRVWHDTTGGGVSWNGYVDIGPVTAGYTELYDMGGSLSGMPWITSNIPTVPTTAIPYHKTVYFDATAGTAGNGTASKPYNTWDAVKADIKSTYRLFGNYSVIPVAAHSSALTLMDVNMGGNGLYIAGAWNDVVTGTVRTAANPSNAVDGTAEITDGSKTFGAYTSYVVRITGGTGSGQIRHIRYNNTTAIYPETKWATKPDGTSTYAVSSYKWKQTGAVTLNNLGNIHIANCEIQTGTTVDGLTAINCSGSFDNVYMHGCKRGMSLTSCPNLTLNGNIAKANTSYGVWSGSSVLILNYNSAALNSSDGFFSEGCPQWYNSYSDSRNNAGWGYNLTNTDNGSGFLKSRSLTNTAGDILIDLLSKIWNITRCIFSGSATNGVYVTGGSTASFGGAATSTTVSGHTNGIKIDMHGRTTGTAALSYSGNTRNKFANNTSYGWSD